MEDIIQKMQGVVRGFCQAEGGNKTGIPFVTAWCFTSEKIQMPKTETVGLSNILYSQGSKESSEFFFRREPAKGTHR